MATDRHDGETMIELEITKSALAGPVLERLVSAAAVRAEFPVDRVINAMTVVDSLIDATDRVIGDGAPRRIAVMIGDRKLAIAVNGLVDGQAEALREATVLPEVGDVIERTASGVEIRADGSHTALIVSLD